MEIKEVISYEIYNIKKGTYIDIDDYKNHGIMHIDATLKDEKGNKFDVSVNDFENHDLTMKLFKLISEKFVNEKSIVQNQNFVKKTDDSNDEFTSQTINENEAISKKHRKIDSPETVIKVIENSTKKTGDYQELPIDNKLDNFEENIDPLTVADLAATNDSPDDKSKKKEIDLTSSDDGLYHDSIDDQEGDNFGNDEY